MGLYNKYRPTSFDDMIGDFSNLQAEIAKVDGSHVFLFDGITGTGKSTAARIVAEYLGATGFDFIEINASDATGVDDMRDALDRIDYVPQGKSRVIFFDEVHRLSAAAWSLLRTPTEDVAPYNYFIFATSQASKVPKDNRGRSFVVNFPPIKEDAIYKLLKGISLAEGFEIDMEVLAAISEAAGGSARKAIVDLESIVGMPADLRMDATKRLGTEDDAEVIELARAVYGGANWSTIAATLKALKEGGVEAETIRRTLLSYGSSMLLNNNAKGSICKHFVDTTYETGFPGIVIMCYKARGF